ncbi:FprA family A-type flavoprotein [Methanocaldococcus sp.]
MVIEIKNNIYWVGAIDWEVREFHGYETIKGSTYNSYLIVDEKNVLIDTTKPYLFDDLILGISSVIDPKNIDYIVCNHSENDHSGSLEELIKLTGATVITSDKGKEFLDLQYDTSNWNFKVVDNGEELSIGRRTLKFIKTPMLHWPDNMVTYCQEDKILFSNDAFGQHIATSERFDYEVESVEEMYEDAKEYFANILMPYKMLVPNVINQLNNLDIDYICPSHGVIWSKYIKEIINKYLEWSSDKCKNKAVIIYDTMYNSTKKMAHAIGQGLYDEGVEIRIFRVSDTPLNTIMKEVLDAKYIIIGSPTLNSNLYPPVAKLLTYMEGLKPSSKKIGVAFGSYGWMEMATSKIKEYFKRLNFKIVDDECLKIRHVPKEEDLKKLMEFGKRLAKEDV